MRCVLAVVCLFVLGIGGCTKKEQEARSGVKEVKDFFKFPTNSQGNTVEQQQILDRYKVTTDPTKVLWIHLIALDGKIVRRMPVRSKVTSSGKRVEPTEAASSNQHATNYPRFGSYETKEFIQSDGTFGHSDSYIYWFDPQGRYHQWGTAGGLGYLLTDYPIDLKDPIDEITGMYKMSREAHEWQVRQEAELKKKN